ncbi:MAG: hypothetical protein GY771_16755, partial [bacterium]|nr:hypothetical protein [bacterium]
MFTDLLQSHPAYRDTLKRLATQATATLGGVSDEGAPLFLAALSRDIDRPLLVITANDEAAESIAAALPTFDASGFELFPPYDVIPFEPLSPDHYILGRRISALSSAAGGSSLIAPARAVMRRLPPPDDILGNSFELSVGCEYDLEELTAKLSYLGYDREEMVEGPGQFARRGGILDVFPPATDEPLRAEFFGDILDDMRAFDIVTQRRTAKITNRTIMPCSELLLDEERAENGLRKILSRCGAEMEERVRDAVELYGNFEGIENLLPYFIEKP